ncbi:hypothetical protein Fmac_014647 [Flemingia macrophylla]|uniref:Uncharacterized protein n=1 Tax=Flemingia macrophylla TaxID=520843 RepID=A0ABD1MCD9_9FABA
MDTYTLLGILWTDQGAKRTLYSLNCKQTLVAATHRQSTNPSPSPSPLPPTPPAPDPPPPPPRPPPLRRQSRRRVDSDDDFLLIEAAFHLPRWLNPDTSLHRLFLRNRTLRIVPKSLPNPSLLDSFSFISSSQSLASDPIQRAIQNCIRDYPHRAQKNMHRVPVSVAHLLRHEPRLISLAVDAFYDRDIDTIKFVGAMERFLERGKAEELVRISVTMSRAMYAQLVQQRFQDPKCYPEMSGRSEREAFVEAELG